MPLRNASRAEITSGEFAKPVKNPKTTENVTKKIPPAKEKPKTVMWADLFKECVASDPPECLLDDEVNEITLRNWQYLSFYKKLQWIQCHAANKHDYEIIIEEEQPEQTGNIQVSSNLTPIQITHTPASSDSSPAQISVDMLADALRKNNEGRGDTGKRNTDNIGRNWPVKEFKEPEDVSLTVVKLLAWFTSFEKAAKKLEIHDDSDKIYLLEIKSGTYLEKVCTEMPGGTDGRTYEEVKTHILKAPNQKYDKVSLEKLVLKAERQSGEKMLAFVVRLKELTLQIPFSDSEREEVFMAAIDAIPEIASSVKAIMLSCPKDAGPTGKPYEAAIEMAKLFDNDSRNKAEEIPVWKIESPFQPTGKPCKACGNVHKYPGPCAAMSKECSNCHVLGHVWKACPNPKVVMQPQAAQVQQQMRGRFPFRGARAGQNYFATNRRFTRPTGYWNQSRQNSNSQLWQQAPQNYQASQNYQAPQNYQVPQNYQAHSQQNQNSFQQQQPSQSQASAASTSRENVHRISNEVNNHGHDIGYIQPE